MNRKVIPALAAIAICLCPSCGKLTGDGGKSHAIRVKVSGVDTKAQVVTTSTLVETLKEFNMSAYVTQAWSRDVLDGTTDDIPAGLYFNDAGLYFNDVKVLYSDGTQKWTVTGNEDEESPAWSWVNGVPINFFAYAPVSVNGTRTLTKDATSITTEYPFSYATKNGSTGTVTSADCDDIIFAGVTNTAQYGDEKDRPDVSAGQGYGQDEAGYGNLINGTTDTINLHFYHALSQVRFCLSTDDDTYDSSLKLVSARILGTRTSSEGVEPATYAGLNSSGKCVFNYSNTPAVSSGADVSAAFTWSDLAAPCTYSQTFDADFSSGTPKNWTSGSYTPSGASEAKNLFTCTGDAFFIVPQTLSGCKIEVTFQQGEETPVSSIGTLEDVTWKAGMYYTYKIKAEAGSEDEISFSVSLYDWAEREHYIPID